MNKDAIDLLRRFRDACLVTEDDHRGAPYTAFVEEPYMGVDFFLKVNHLVKKAERSLEHRADSALVKKFYLRRCPFCGSPFVEMRSNGIGDYYVICYSAEMGDPACGARTSDFRCETPEKAQKRWNNRIGGTTPNLMSLARLIAGNIMAHRYDDPHFGLQIIDGLHDELDEVKGATDGLSVALKEGWYIDLTPNAVQEGLEIAARVVEAFPAEIEVGVLDPSATPVSGRLLRPTTNRDMAEAIRDRKNSYDE